MSGYSPSPPCSTPGRGCRRSGNRFDGERICLPAGSVSFNPRWSSPLRRPFSAFYSHCCCSRGCCSRLSAWAHTGSPAQLSKPNTLAEKREWEGGRRRRCLRVTLMKGRSEFKCHSQGDPSPGRNRATLAAAAVIGCRPHVVTASLYIHIIFLLAPMEEVRKLARSPRTSKSRSIGDRWTRQG